jgi:hypothetical protein
MMVKFLKLISRLSQECRKKEYEKKIGDIRAMTTMSNERIDFYPQRDMLGNTIGPSCACPTWMCWMHWLVDGVKVLHVQGKTVTIEKTSRQHHAGLK